MLHTSRYFLLIFAAHKSDEWLNAFDRFGLFVVTSQAPTIPQPCSLRKYRWRIHLCWHDGIPSNVDARAKQRQTMTKTNSNAFLILLSSLPLHNIYIYIYLYHITQYTQPSTLSRGLHLREIPTWHFFANSKSAIQNPNGFVWAKRKKERTEEKRTRLRPHSMAAGVCETPLSSLVFSSSNWSTPCLLISRNNSTILEYSWSKSKSKFQPCCKKLAACWYRYLVVLGSKMVEALSFCIFAFSDLQYLKLWIVFRLSWWDGSTLNRWTCVPVLEEITQERLFPRVWVDAENVIAPQNNYRGIMYLHEDWPTPNPWTQSPKQSGSSSCGHSHFAPWTHDIANDNYSLVLGCFISLGKHNNKTTNIRVHTFD